MSEVDKINEQIAALTAQRESVMLKERAKVLAKLNRAYLCSLASHIRICQYSPRL